MYENKTAKYTFEGPLHLGATLAGAGDDFCNQLSEYAIPLGIAFQIRDDILGVFGDEKKTGKSAQSDIVEGKKTFMVNYAYKNATREQKQVLDSSLGNKNISASEIKKFRDVIIDTGALDKMEKYMQQLLLDSKKALSEMSVPENVTKLFLGLADYLNKREI